MSPSPEHLNIDPDALAAAIRNGYGDQQIEFDETGQIIIPNSPLVKPEFSSGDNGDMGEAV